MKVKEFLARYDAEEELAQKKKAAIEEAERELKEKDIGQEIYELACILYKNKEYNLGWHDCIYLADQAVKQGYRKQVEAEWIAKSKMIRSPFARNYYCSICNYEPLEGLKYCPNCGAHMRKRE